jgi:hypothetical protein
LARGKHPDGVKDATAGRPAPRRFNLSLPHARRAARHDVFLWMHDAVGRVRQPGTVRGVRLAGLAALFREPYSLRLSRNSKARAHHEPAQQDATEPVLSQQSGTGMTDEGLSIARVGLEHLERLVPGHVRDFD